MAAAFLLTVSLPLVSSSAGSVSSFKMNKVPDKPVTAERARQYRALRQQPCPAVRGRRQGAGRLYEAARGRRRQDRNVGRGRRRGEDARQGRGILARRSVARDRIAVAVSAAPISISGARRSSGSPANNTSPSPSPIRATAASPIRNGRRTSSSISSSRPICSRRNGPTISSRMPRTSIRIRGTRPSSICARSRTRSRRRISS